MRVNLRLVKPPSLMLALVKVLATVASVTVRVALAAVPVRATGPVAVGALVVLRLVLVAVTLWVMVQVPPGTMVPAVKPTLAPVLTPPLRVAVPAPLHKTLPAALLTSVPM